MVEYGELSYSCNNYYVFIDSNEIKETIVEYRDDVRMLNSLAENGWRVVSVQDSKYLLERERTHKQSIDAGFMSKHQHEAHQIINSLSQNDIEKILEGTYFKDGDNSD